jgi:hypothetical protein
MYCMCSEIYVSAMSRLMVPRPVLAGSKGPITVDWTISFESWWTKCP